MRIGSSSPHRTQAVARDSGGRAGTYAAIDMGSSSAKMLVLRRQADGSWKTLVDVRETTFLGKGIGVDKMIPAANQERALAALRRFVAMAGKYGVEPKSVGMIATAVMRNTVNGPQFAKQIT